MQKDFDGTAEQETAEQQNLNGKKHNGITALFCVLTAICIWFYVMSVDSPTSTKTYSSVPVRIVNDRSTLQGNNLVPMSVSDIPDIIEVTLKGRKTVLNSLTAENIEAYIDVSNVMVSGKGSYEVIVEAPAGTVIEEY